MTGHAGDLPTPTKNRKKKTITFDEAAKMMHEPDVFKEDAKEMAKRIDLFVLKYGGIGLKAVQSILKVK